MLNQTWTGENDLPTLVIDSLPDTRVRDGLIQAHQMEGKSIQEVGKMIGSSGYVAESVPLTIYAAQQIQNRTVEQIFTALLQVGGDTDTICSMTGQILGSLLGADGFPASWLEKFHHIQDSLVIEEIIKNWR